MVEKNGVSTLDLRDLGRNFISLVYGSAVPFEALASEIGMEFQLSDFPPISVLRIRVAASSKNFQEDEFLSGVVRSMGSHVRHQRAEMLRMVEVPPLPVAGGGGGEIWGRMGHATGGFGASSPVPFAGCFVFLPCWSWGSLLFPRKVWSLSHVLEIRVDRMPTLLMGAVAAFLLCIGSGQTC